MNIYEYDFEYKGWYVSFELENDEKIVAYAKKGSETKRLSYDQIFRYETTSRESPNQVPFITVEKTKKEIEELTALMKRKIDKCVFTS